MNLVSEGFLRLQLLLGFPKGVASSLPAVLFSLLPPALAGHRGVQPVLVRAGVLRLGSLVVFVLDVHLKNTDVPEIGT